MNKDTKFFIFGIIVLMMIIGAIRYDQYVIQRNFILDVNTSCDPTTESCFVWDCDPKTDEECDQTPYKKVEILEREAPKCLEEHECENFTCEGKDSCTVTYCSEDTIVEEEGEVCTR